MGVFTWPPNDEVVWESWKKRFAFLPTKIRGQHKVWLQFYYEREGRNLYMSCKQRGTMFDVLKSYDK